MTTQKRPLKVGLFIQNFEYAFMGKTARWNDISAMAQRAEEVGFDSVWIADHFILDGQEHGPVGVWECTSLLSALAATTSKVELGTLVICTGFRNPTLLAKMADTIDEISNGRMILGLGAGYHDYEYNAFGYPADHKYSRFEEAIQIISGLLRNGSIDFDGKYYSARECELRPRGPRQDGPPIMIGTFGHKMLRLTAQYANIWNTALFGAGSNPQTFEPRAENFDAACAEVGRDPSTIEKSAAVLWIAKGQMDSTPKWAAPWFSSPIIDEPQKVAETFRQFADMGVSHIQVAVFPSTLEGIEAFRPVLEALDA